MLEKKNIDQCEIEPLEEWLEKDPSDWYCMENIGALQRYFVELYKELNLLEERIESKRQHTELAKIELEEIALKNNEKMIVNCDQWIQNNVITLVIEEDVQQLEDSGKNKF